MISVIIPYMYNSRSANKYHEFLKDCIKSLQRQTADIEIIVNEHKEEEHIRKNYLLNQGLRAAKGDIIWHCDADFTMDNQCVLEKAEGKLRETLYPVFYSRKYKKLKIADGGLMIRREVLERHGPLDETLFGISYVTFPLLKWCMDNTEFDVDPEFVITNNSIPSVKKAHKETRARLEPLYNEVIGRDEYQMFDVR